MSTKIPDPTRDRALRDGAAREAELAGKLAARTARVAVLMGGMSTERPVSLKSGKAVATALRARGYDVHEIDVGPDLAHRLADEKIDVAWIALHGEFGEDGCVQGLLEILRVPYTGSGVRGSALAMDKIVTKRMLRGTGVRLIDDHTWRSGDPVPDDLPLPCVVKTPRGGSTIGVWICKDRGELESAMVKAAELDEIVLIEQFAAGEEITVAVLDGRPLPVVAIRPDSGFFDFEAKYSKGRTNYIVPAHIDAAVALDAQRQAVAAFEALTLAGVARADFIVDDQGLPWFLEINTIPGMTATSLSPMAAGAVGMGFEDLVEHLLHRARLKVQVASSRPGSLGVEL